MIFSAMFSLGLTLISGILAHPVVLFDYLITMEKTTLKIVKPTFYSSIDLNLSNLNIRHIAEGAFENLDGLRKLSLANNRLENLPFFVFRSLRKLEHLSLANNSIDSLRYNFGGLNNLKVLDIRDNGITRLDNSSFYGLTNGTIILADGNNFGKISAEHFQRPTILLSLCIDDGNVKSLEVFDENNDVENNDEENTDECIMKIRELNGDVVDLTSEKITRFEKGWYRLHKLNVKSLFLHYNEITSITSQMLNDLPNGLTKVNLSFNKIKHLENRVIANCNLRELNLRNNSIESVKYHAFVYTKNVRVFIGGNKLSIPIVKRVISMPYGIQILP